MKKLTSHMLPRLLVGVPLAVLLVCWQLAGDNSADVRFFLSTPMQIAETAVSMINQDFKGLLQFVYEGDTDAFSKGLIWNSALTGSEALLGFALGNLVGTAVGISLWFSPTLARLSKPYIAALGAIPVFAIAPLTILWFGIGFSAKVYLAALATAFIAATQAFKGAEQVDSLLLKRLQLFKASKSMVLRTLIVPTALTWIIASLRLTIGAALLGAFIGEYIASEQGIGRLIIRASGIYDTARVFVGILAITAMAIGLDALVGAIEKRVVYWKK